MPYPAQVQRETLIEKSRQLIESNGLDQLTLQALAASVGIAAPSLYHHFKNKTALLAAVNVATTVALTNAVIAASDRTLQENLDAREALAAMLRAYRAYAHADPATYSLIFANTVAALKPDATTAEALAIPLQALMARVVGETKSLPALRGGWALVHGFVMLEIAGQFQRSGDLDQAFELSIWTYIKGL